MMKQSISNIYRHELEKEMKEAECKTSDDALDVLFGTYDNDYRTDLVVKRSWLPAPKQTVLNRINSLWVYPVFIILMPFRYLAFGRASVSEDSKFGRFLIGLVGELK